MRILGLGISTFIALVMTGLLVFFYVVPDGGVMLQLLSLSTEPTVLRDVMVSTTLVCLNLAAACLVILRSGFGGNVRAPLVVAACMVLAVVIADVLFGIRSAREREAWIPWLDGLSILHVGVALAAARMGSASQGAT